MTLSKEQIEHIVSDEIARWRQIHSAVVKEAGRTQGDMHSDQRLARELTAELVNSKSAEDQVQLASDEAVAHGLSKLRRHFTENFEDLARQPYFARVVICENGKEVEFYLGTTSFPKHRIIDWRRAPISQLYYNYREGDEFDELIQGRERSGTIKLRRGYKGSHSELQVIEMPEGIIRKQNDEWIFEDRKSMHSRSAGHDGHLPPILSLITREQFELISHSPDKPVIIQGIAGSGKTTVALHRLAWLLHADNSLARPGRCMVVVFNRALKTYIETTLPELGITGVAIRTYHQWLGSIAREFGGGGPYDDFPKLLETEQFKSSPICLAEINNYVREFPERAGANLREDLFKFFHYVSGKQIFWPRWEKISQDLARQGRDRLCDQQDDSILLGLVYAREGCYPCSARTKFGCCDHIVIDEAQDFGVVDIRALLGALDVDKTVTIVGDIAQKIVMNRHFGSWEELLKEAGFAETMPIKLNVSHRSTEEVMTVAMHLRPDVDLSDAALKASRKGPTPTIAITDSYETQPHLIGKWMEARTKENPRSLSAIICRWPKQAEALVGALKKIGYSFVRWGYRENFDFSPGVTVTNVHQIKGLEFLNVLIVNPTEDQYNPAKEEERNLLYVAATRAELRLDFICKGKPTSMLPALQKKQVTGQ